MATTQNKSYIPTEDLVSIFDAIAKKFNKTVTTGNVLAKAGNNINSVGTPSVSVQEEDGKLVFTFNFLKGEKGEKGEQGASGASAGLASASANGLMSSAMFTKLNNLPTVWKGTQSQYDAITSKSSNTLYLIYES